MSHKDTVTAKRHYLQCDCSLWRQSQGDRWRDEEQKEVSMADSPILSYSLLQEISPFSILKHIPSHETDFLPGPHPLFSNSHLLICNCMLNSTSLQEHNRERRTHFLSVTIRNAHKSYLMACNGKGEVVAIWYIPRPPLRQAIQVFVFKKWGSERRLYLTIYPTITISL